MHLADKQGLQIQFSVVPINQLNSKVGNYNIDMQCYV